MPNFFELIQLYAKNDKTDCYFYGNNDKPILVFRYYSAN